MQLFSDAISGARQHGGRRQGCVDPIPCDLPAPCAPCMRMTLASASDGLLRRCSVRVIRAGSGASSHSPMRARGGSRHLFDDLPVRCPHIHGIDDGTMASWIATAQATCHLATASLGDGVRVCKIDAAANYCPSLDGLRWRTQAARSMGLAPGGHGGGTSIAFVTDMSSVTQRGRPPLMSLRARPVATGLQGAGQLLGL